MTDDAGKVYLYCRKGSQHGVEVRFRPGQGEQFLSDFRSNVQTGEPKLGSYEISGSNDDSHLHIRLDEVASMITGPGDSSLH